MIHSPWAGSLLWAISRERVGHRGQFYLRATINLSRRKTLPSQLRIRIFLFFFFIKIRHFYDRKKKWILNLHYARRVRSTAKRVSVFSRPGQQISHRCPKPDENQRKNSTISNGCKQPLENHQNVLNVRVRRVITR